MKNGRPRLLLFCVLFMSCNTRDINLLRPSTWFPETRSAARIEILPNTSPANVLENLITSYNHRNEALYRSLLSPDYRFYMSASYLGMFNRTSGVSPDPADWILEIKVDSAGIPLRAYYKDFDREMNSIHRMFDPAGQAADIELFFQYSALDESRSDTARFAIRNIELTVTLRNNTIPFQVSDRQSNAPTEVRLARGPDNLWRIYRWDDGTYGAGDDM